MQVRKEWVGVGEDRFHGGVWHFTTRLFSVFLANFYITGPGQHSKHHSNPLIDILLFLLPKFWSFWEWLSFWHHLITKGPAFDDHSPCSSFWMLNRDICTVLKWTRVLTGYKAVILCRWTMLYMYFRQIFSPPPLFCSVPCLKGRGTSSKFCTEDTLNSSVSIWQGAGEPDLALPSFHTSDVSDFKRHAKPESNVFSCQCVIITQWCKIDSELLLSGLESGKKTRSWVNFTHSPQMS